MIPATSPDVTEVCVAISVKGIRSAGAMFITPYASNEAKPAPINKNVAAKSVSRLIVLSGTDQRSQNSQKDTNPSPKAKPALRQKLAYSKG